MKTQWKARRNPWTPILKPDAPRETLMVLRYLNGESMSEIGRDYGFSREWIRQLLKRAGVESRGQKKFRPMVPGDLLTSRQRRQRRQRARRRKLVNLGRAFVAKHGRHPRQHDEYVSVFGSTYSQIGLLFDPRWAARRPDKPRSGSLYGLRRFQRLIGGTRPERGRYPRG
jgi:transposase-like protein